MCPIDDPHDRPAICIARDGFVWDIALPPPDEAMMQYAIDPTSRDYTVTGGQPLSAVARGLLNAMYLRIVTPRGSYWADPDFGSRLHELQRGKDLAKWQTLAAQYVREALQPILDDGRATALDVGVLQPHDGRLLIEATLTAADGERVVFSHPVEVI